MNSQLRGATTNSVIRRSELMTFLLSLAVFLAIGVMLGVQA